MSSLFFPLSSPPIPVMFPLPLKFIISSLITRFEIWYEVPVCQNICSLDVKINTILLDICCQDCITIVGKMAPLGTNFRCFRMFLSQASLSLVLIKSLFSWVR